MRTTLTIDDDVLEAVRQLAADQRRTLGEVISELARQSLHSMPEPREARIRNGFAALAGSGHTITSSDVYRLQELDE
ncbi:ribbon-helix-helix protein, CopG family [Luteococcus sp. H138]|uniref:ribbon-helix-helix protein, CopG family n=1 Tax=unclassified Luteococcus TaxID=2639923 RepID=UPI00313C94D0